MSRGNGKDNGATRPPERVQVASVQTLSQRAIRTDTIPLPIANVLVIDECSPSWQQGLTPAVTAMDAAKLGMAPMEGTCRAGR
jgi:hypothetical protein